MMMRWIVVGFALAAMLSACAADRPTSADRASSVFGGESRSGDAAATARLVRLNPPPDYCALDRSQLVDAVSLHLLQKAVDGVAQLLSVWRDCSELAATRRGTVLFEEPSVAITVVVKEGEPVRTAVPRAEFLEMVAVIMPALRSDRSHQEAVEKELRRRFDDSVGQLAKSLGQRAAMGDLTDLGVRAKDRNAVYLAMITRADSGQRDLVLDNIIAVTQVRGLVMEVAFFANRTGEASLDRLLAEAQAIMSRIVSDNDHATQTDV